MISNQQGKIIKVCGIVLLILIGICLIPTIYILFWNIYPIFHHPGKLIYNFDDDNASFYIQQVENNINFSHYQEEYGSHLVYSLSGGKCTAGVNITKLSEIETCRIYNPNSTILADIEYSSYSYTFSLYLNQSYITSPDNESEYFSLRDLPSFQWSFAYPIYFISISMDYDMICGNVCGRFWEEYYWFLIHENGDILVKINKEDCKCVVA